MAIINLTQHLATPEQIEEGVVDLTGKQREELVRLLTFDDAPDSSTLLSRALTIARLVGKDNHFAMIGGAPYFMSYLENSLRACRVRPVYSFSKRVSVEVTNEDGSVTKTNVFKHTGWVGI